MYVSGVCTYIRLCECSSYVITCVFMYPGSVLYLRKCYVGIQLLCLTDITCTYAVLMYICAVCMNLTYVSVSEVRYVRTYIHTIQVHFPYLMDIRSAYINIRMYVLIRTDIVYKCMYVRIYVRNVHDIVHTSANYLLASTSSFTSTFHTSTELQVQYW